jgi:prepilin-type N-terminal cleavage/methylation domain-containing protein
MNRAFTLVELLIVIAIIGILTAVAAVSYTGIQARGRDAERKNDLNQIKVALTAYYNAQVPTQYLPSSSNCVSTTTNCATIAINDSTDLLTAAIKPLYIRDVPIDPTNVSPYVYEYTSGPLNSVANQAFTLNATLENKNDQKGWGGGSSWVTEGFSVQSQ